MSDLRDHVERIKAAGQARRTVMSRVDVITRVGRDLGVPLPAATTQQLASWLGANAKWARKTRAIYLYHIRTYYAFLTEIGRIEENPALGLARVRTPKLPPRPVPEDVLVRILERARNPRWQLYFTLAAYGGLRCEEIARLTTDDVTKDRIVVVGKGDKVRVVPTHPRVWQLVSALPSGPVCHFGPDSVKAAKALSRYGSAYLTRLGFKGVTMHMFRHRFGTATYRVRRNLRAVQILMGHASIATTEGYVYVDDEELRLAVQELPAA